MAKIFRDDTPHPLFTKRHALIAGIVVLVIVAIVYVVMSITKQISEQSGVAFTIDSRSYSKEEVSKLIQLPLGRGGEKEATAKQAFEYLKRQTAAKKASIEVSEESIAASRDALFPESKEIVDPDTLEWIDLVSYDAALEKALNDRKVTDANGYVFVFPFNQRVTDLISGDPAIIAEDRAYAESRAKYYHSALTAGTMTVEAAHAEVEADSRLGQPGFANTNPSLRFEGYIRGDASRPEVLLREDIADEVMKRSSKLGIGDITTGKVVEGEAESDVVDANYFFVVIDKPSSDTKDKVSLFEQTLKDLPSHYRGID